MPQVNRWKYNAKTNRFECPICAYTHEEQAGVQMHHMRQHEGLGGKGKKDSPPPATAGRKAPAGGECEHTYQMLTPGDTLQGRALRAGFAVYCRNCGHLK